jgi:hypothetical protein
MISEKWALCWMHLLTSENGAYGPFETREAAEKNCIIYSNVNDGLHYWIVGPGESMPNQVPRIEQVIHQAERFGLAKKENLVNMAWLVKAVEQRLIIEHMMRKRKGIRK